MEGLNDAQRQAPDHRHDDRRLDGDDLASRVLDPLKAKLLLAYPYATERLIKGLAEQTELVDLMIDSGAYSAWKIGEEVTLDGYCRFLEGLPFRPWRYLQLDVVGDADATMANFLKMRAMGFDPIPVFTRGAPLDHFTAYRQMSDLVAIGGLVQTKGNGGFVAGVMKAADGHKLHLLGFKKSEYLKFFKPYSCDSTNWTRGGRYGWIDVYRGAGRMDNLLRKSIAAKLDDQAISTIRAYGLDPYELRLADAWSKSNGMASVLPAYSWLDYSFDAARNIGVNVFMAFINQWQFETLIAAAVRIRQNYKDRRR
jgi:hypothetical protein